MKKIVALLLVAMIALAGCSSEKNNTSGVVEDGQVVLTSPENTNFDVLQFKANIRLNNVETNKPFSVRFLVEDQKLEDLIKSSDIVLPDQYFKGNDETVSVGDMRIIYEKYTADEIKSIIEKNDAVVLELFNGDEVFHSEPVTLFVNNK